MGNDDAGLIDATATPGLEELSRRSGAVIAWNARRGAVAWANPAALCLWRSETIADFATRHGAPARNETRQFARIAESLKPGARRLERIRVNVRGAQSLLTCLCRWMDVAGEPHLIVEGLAPVPGFSPDPASPSASSKPSAMDEAAASGDAGGPADALTPEEALGAEPDFADTPEDAVMEDGGQDEPAGGGHGPEPCEDAAAETSRGEDADEDERGHASFTFEPTWDHGDEFAAEYGEQTVVFSGVPEGEGARARGTVLPFRGGRVTPDDIKGLEAHERDAFRAIAEALGARMEEDAPADAGEPGEAIFTRSAWAARLGVEASTVADDAMSVLERLHLGLLVFRDRTALFANRAFVEMFGFDDFTDLARTCDVVALLPQLPRRPGGEAAMPGQPADVNALVARTRDGDAFAVLCRLQAVRWAGDTAMLLSVHKLHDRSYGTAPAREREAEAGASPREAPVETAIGLATSPVIAISADGTIMAANARARRLLALGEDGHAGHRLRELIAPDSAAAFDAYLALAGSGEASAAPAEGRELAVRPLRGAEVPVHLVLEPVAGTESFAAIFRDLGQWKQAEAELVRARREAEQASAQKSDLVARVSHEIRTPLNSIIGFSEMMLRAQFGPLGHDKYQEYAQGIRDSGAHVLGLINDLLDLSKIEAGKLELNFTSVNLNEVVSQAVRSIQPEAGRARVITRSSLAPRLPAIVADHRSLVQICLNLLSNAIKFTPAGGQAVISTMLSGQGEVQVRVRDTGVGMNRDEIRFALEPFRQLGNAANANVRGTGLGLPLTKALAEANRARFSIESESGKGTLIEVTFPTARVLAE